MDSNKNSFLLNVKRGVKWSERKVELTSETLQYFNPKKNANNPKKYRIKLSSKTGKFKDIKLSCDDYTIIQKFKLKYDEIIINNSTLNNLKSKNLVVRTNSNLTMPISNVQEIQNSSILDKINESEIKTNLNATTTNINISNMVNNVTGFIDESNVYDPRKSLLTEKEDKDDDSEYSRKGKNVVDKYKHSLPSTMFKKREFIIDKNKTSPDEKASDKLSIIQEVESSRENKGQNITTNPNEEFIQRGNAQSVSSRADIPQTLSEKRNEKNNFEEENQNRMLVGSQNIIPKIIEETHIARPWRLIKSSLFSLFEYNGEYCDIFKEVKKSLRKQYKETFADSIGQNNWLNLQRNNFEYNKFFLRVCVFLTFLFIYILFTNYSYTHSFGLISLIIVLYLFIFDVRNIFNIESKLEKKFKNEKSLKLNDQIKNSSIFENKEKENNLAKGNLIRISTLFNGEKNEICDLLNDFSAFTLTDKNIIKSGADNYYNNANYKNNDNLIKSHYYQITLKTKNKCFRRGKMSNNKIDGEEDEKSNVILIKREINTFGINNKFTTMIDFIKDEDQNDKILRILFIENLSDNNETNLNDTNFNPNNHFSNKSTLVTLFIPIDFYTNISKTTLDAKDIGKFQKEMFKKKSLFKSNLNFLDNIQTYYSNNLLNFKNSIPNKLNNMQNLAMFIDEKLASKHYNLMQTDFSSTIYYNFRNQIEFNYQITNNNPNNNLVNSNNILDEIMNNKFENRKSINSNIDEQIAKMENLGMDPSRKSTLQRFNEIGNRYSFSDISEASQMQGYNQMNQNANSNIFIDKSVLDNTNINNTFINNNTAEAAIARYPEFIDKSDINMNSILNNTVAGDFNKKSVKFSDEVTTIFSNNNDVINNNLSNNINLNNQIKIEDNIDPILKKENEEIFKILDDKCAEMESFLNRDWKILEEKDGFKSFYFDEKSGLRSIKSHIVINKNITFLSEYLQDLNKRASYDKNFDHGKILRQIDDSHNISYLKFKGKIMISPRDFVVCARREITENEIRMILTNYESPKYGRNKGVERAEMKVAGFILKKIDDNTTSVTNFVCSDLKLSQMLVNTSLKEVAQSIKVLKDILAK